MKPISKNLSVFVIAIMLIGMYYNSYRYPFMINSTETSPTYSDTPGWLSLGKYILVSIALIYALFGKVLISKQIKVYKTFYAFSYLCLSIVAIVSGTLIKDAAIAEIGVFFLVPFVLHLFWNNFISVLHLNKIILSAIYISILAEVIQVFLFLQYGRLPALAYEDSIAVRFGSFLDDPNGFGILIAFFIGFSIVYFKGITKIILLGSFFLFLLLTQSITAIIAVSFSIVIYILLLVYQPNRLVQTLSLITPFLVLATILVFIYFDNLQELYIQFLEYKADSVSDHLSVFNFFSLATPLQFLGLNPQGRVGESGYINLLSNFGFLYMLVYISVGLLAIGNYYKLIRAKGTSTDMKAFATGAFLFLTTTCVATIGLPLEEIFPINLLMTLILGLVSSGVLKDTSLHLRNKPSFYSGNRSQCNYQ